MNFKKKYYRSQIYTKDCGVAALAMIFSYYGSYYSLETLRELVKMTEDGVTAFGLVKGAENKGLQARAVRTNMSLFDRNINYPFIVHVIKNNVLLHYYVVTGCSKDKIYIADPDPHIKLTHMSRKEFEKEWTGVAIFFKKTKDYKVYREKKRTLLSFLPILKVQKKVILIITVLTLTATIINIIGSYYLQTIIDTYIPNEAINTLNIVSLGLIIAYLLQQIITYFQEYLMLVLGQRLSSDIILPYIKHILTLTLSFFLRKRTGDITSRFTDANSIIEALTNTVFSVVLDMSTMIIVSIVLFSQNKLLFLMSSVAVPLYVIVIFSFVKYFERINHETMEANAILSSSIIEDINGIETIKSLTSETQRYLKITQEFKNFLNKSFAYSKSNSLQKALKTLIKLLLNVATLWFGANLVMDNKITVGQLIAYNTLLVYFTQPLENLINLQPKLQTARVANDRLNEVYLVQSEFKEKKDNFYLNNFPGQITFKNVDFQYGYQKKVLSDINLTIKPGSKIVLVGSSGSGKTTLAKMLVNFYSPTKGKILLDGIDLHKIDKKDLRNFINYLPQNPYIFNGTILENLTLGVKKNITQEDIFKAVQLAEIKTEIEELPLGYQTELHTDGGISGGQQQRIALARALISDAKILILDEATSNLDTMTEKKIINNLMSLNKTIIFIAHHLSIAEKSEYIFVLDDGKIIEKGSHSELLNNGGFYAKLFES